MRAVYLPTLFLSLAWGVTVPIMPLYLGTLGAGVGTIGLILSLKGFGQVVSDIPGGFFVARFGQQRVIAVAYGGSALLSLALGLVSTLVSVGLFFFLFYILSSTILTSVMTHVRRHGAVEGRGKTLARVGGFMRIGAMIGPALGGFVAEYLGYNWVFVLQAIFLLGGLTFALCGIRKSGDCPSQTEPIKIPTKASRLYDSLGGRWGTIIPIGLGIVLISILRSGREVILPMVGEIRNLSPSLIGAILALGAAFDLLLFLPAGYISDRWGRKVAASLCLGGMGLGFFFLVPPWATLGFVAGAIVIGLGNGLGAGIHMATGVDLAPEEAAPQFLGLWRFYGDLGHGASPVIFSTVVAGAGLLAGIGIFGLMGFVGVAIMTFWAPETRPR